MTDDLAGGGGGDGSGESQDSLFASIKDLLAEARAKSLGAAGAEGDEAAEGMHAPPQYDSTVVRDFSDDRLWKDVLASEDGQTRSEVDAAQSISDTSSDLYRDVFASLYKAVPQIRPTGEVDAAHQLNRELMEQTMSTEEWRTLRQLTALDPLHAAWATRNITKRLLESLGGATERDQRAVEAAQTRETGTATDLGDVAAEGQDALERGEIEKAGALPRQAKEMLGDLASKQAATQAAAAQLTQSLAGAGERARMALRDAAKEAAQEIADEKAAAAALTAGDEGGGWSPSGAGTGGVGQSMADKVAMARTLQNSPRMLKIAKRAGKYRIMAAAAQRRKAPNSRDEIRGTTGGRDLDKLLASERARLATPALRPSFYADYAAGKLMLATFEGKEKQGEGPVVICIDDSGSMSGLPEQCAKAAALAIVAVCRAKKRDVALLLFNTRIARNEVFVGGGSRSDWRRLLGVIEYFGGGGTLYEPWIKEASALVHGSSFQKADVIVITDGLCAVPAATVAAWRSLRTERDFSCVGILLAAPGGGAGVLADLCDRVHILPPQADWPDDVLMDLFTEA